MANFTGMMDLPSYIQMASRLGAGMAIITGMTGQLLFIRMVSSIGTGMGSSTGKTGLLSHILMVGPFGTGMASALWKMKMKIPRNTSCKANYSSNPHMRHAGTPCPQKRKYSQD
jgi:hypothetical protein